MHIDWQRILLCALLFIPLLLACGFTYEWTGGRRDLRLRPAPGRLVSVGDHRLHLLAKGTVAPTVVIEQGAGELSRFWWPLQDKVAEFARVYTYDRAGFGWSEMVRKGRTIEDRVEELHTLLTRANVEGPYIFVAHSYGGLMVRSYARMYPDETGALVLVDTPEESSIFRKEVLAFYSKMRILNRIVALLARFGLLRLLRHWLPLDQFGFWLERPDEYLALCDDLASLERVPQPERSSKAAGSLGDLPMIVLTHGQAFPGPFAILEKNWNEGQQRLVALSSSSKLVVAENSNHMIQQDEPELVLSAIKEMHAAVGSGCRVS